MGSNCIYRSKEGDWGNNSRTELPLTGHAMRSTNVSNGFVQRIVIWMDRNIYQTGTYM